MICHWLQFGPREQIKFIYKQTVQLPKYEYFTDRSGQITRFLTY
jgi:hypothetical protein